MGPTTRTDLEVRERELVAEMVRRRRARPLAYAELWHRELPHTSQRVIGSMLTDPAVDAVLVSGGTGAGKTRLGAQVAVAMALGRRHPDAQAWCRRNAFPLWRLPDRPGRVIASALTSKFSIRVQRPATKLYLPQGCTWRNELGDGEASVSMPGATGKLGQIVFLSNDQGMRSFEGDEADFFWPDEEHDRDVFNAGMMRVSRVAGGMGFALMTMTPLLGLTWVYDDFVQEPKTGRRAMWIWGEDNPYLPHEKMERVLSGYGEHEQAARRRGEFTAPEGLVYKLQRNLHVVPQGTHLDSFWARYVAIDFGVRNPACWLWFAHDPGDDTLHVYREHYQAGWMLSQHAAHFHAVYKANPQEPKPRIVVADPEDLNARLELASKHGIGNVPARKDIRPGINAVAERMAPDITGKTHLLIHANCTNLLREMAGYRWPETGTKEVPVAKDNHAMDALRYLVYYLSSGRFSVGATTTNEEAA